MEFSPLTSDDVEVRVSQVNDKGVALLLYKDARCDMRALDAAVGAENWACRYDMVNSALFCSVGIRCGDEWVWKQDVGVKSNMESTKGEASDAFKRACFKWGIGRELYTAPFIWVPAASCALKKNNKGKWVCYDRFKVSKFEVKDGKITDLAIIKEKTGTQVYPSKSVKPNNTNIDAARRDLKDAIDKWAAATGKDAKVAMQGVSKRQDYEQTEDFYMRVAQEFEDAANE